MSTFLLCSEKSDVRYQFEDILLDLYHCSRWLYFSAGQFHIPEYLNKSVVSLLCHMMQVDPMQRASIQDIKTHDWFKKDLAAYLFPLPTEQDSSAIDNEAVREVCEKFTVTEKEVTSALLCGDPHDQLSIAYHLIVDNKRIEDETSKMDKDFYVTSSPPPTSSLISPNVPPGRQRIYSGGHITNRGELHRNTPMRRAKWHLGIRSQSKPQDIMNEVFRAMKSLGFEWKIVSPYHIRARKKNQVTERFNKMSLQLYQVDYKSYLLDFKSLPVNEPLETEAEDANAEQIPTSSPDANASDAVAQGSHHIMEFFEMCAALITQLARWFGS